MRAAESILRAIDGARGASAIRVDGKISQSFSAGVFGRKDHNKINMSYGDRPSPDEVDSLASFVEAIAELEAEPFFSRDEPRTLSATGDKFTYRLGDRSHFRSALITFRRIWMQRDAENFDRVCNIISKHTTPTSNGFLAFERDAVRRELEAYPSMPKRIDVTNRELVDLWLNAVFAHSGLRGRTKLRHRFDALIERYGSGCLEFAFRQVVFTLGLHYRNIKGLAQNLLKHWKAEFGMSPSFQAGSPFGTKRRERTTDGELIVRESSSEYYSEENYDQRFTRILGRPEFRNLESMLKSLQLSDRELLPHVLKHDTCTALVNESMLTLRTVARMPENPASSEGLKFFGEFFDHRRGLIWRLLATDSEILTDADGLTILDSQLQDLKRELINS